LGLRGSAHVIIISPHCWLYQVLQVAREPMTRCAKFVRLCALGLMLILSVAANCASESYDPDPYDNIPPVTVDFEYLTPHITTAPSRHEDVARSMTSATQRVIPHSSRDLQVISVSLPNYATQASFLFALPLRR
jgi:hypothetical protein